MITAKDIIEEIDEALRMFGEYTYGDKGAEEVMDIPGIANRLKEHTGEEIIAILTEIVAKHRYPDPCLTSILYRLQDWQSPEAEILFDSSICDEYY